MAPCWRAFSQPIMPTSIIQRALWAALLGLTALWLWAEPTPWPQPFHYFAFRASFMQYSGALAIGAMSVAMVLAVRPTWLEPHLRGLDKMYRLHKWLGITALVTSVAHWWLGQGTKWMVGWGWLVRPPRGPRPSPADQGVLEAWFGSQRHLAETVGEWAFYAAAVLMMLALVKRFPYHWFAKTHTVLAALYLALVFHSAVLVKFPYWGSALGVVLAVLMAGGSVAAVLVLGGRVGARRKVSAEVVSTMAYPGVNALHTTLRVGEGWPGHRAGQFAFVTFDPKEGAHPYTLASAWDAQTRCLSLVTKALGDHTRRLPELVKPGLQATVEGPYGCFDFDDAQPRQIWIGAGIGITPFIARMQQLTAQGLQGVSVDLFHPTAQRDDRALAQLRADARAAGIRLHVLVDAQDGRLDGAHIRRLVPEWLHASVWFCGPVGLGQALLADLRTHGLVPQRFHQELFQMR